MRHFLFILCLAPWLVAPVRFQQGEGEIILTPSQAPTGSRGKAAVALPSPTIIAVSPTRVGFTPISLTQPSLTTLLAEGQPSPTTPLTTNNLQLPTASMPAPQAALCVRTLGLINDLASVSMAQSGRENLVPLTIAATIAQTQAAQGVWPNIAAVRQAGIPFFTPNRAELAQALGYATSFCQNPAAESTASGLVNRPR